MATDKSGVRGAIPRFLQRDEVHPALPLPHVPKIGRPPIEFSLCPGPPDAVMMDMVWREIVSDRFAFWGVNRVQISPATK